MSDRGVSTHHFFRGLLGSFREREVDRDRATDERGDDDARAQHHLRGSSIPQRRNAESNETKRPSRFSGNT